MTNERLLTVLGGEVESDDLGGAGGGGGFRAIRAQLHGADNAVLHAGLVIGRLAHGEHVGQVLTSIQVGFDGVAPNLSLGTPGDPQLYTAGTILLDTPDDETPGANGLVIKPLLTDSLNTNAAAGAGAVSVAPPAGVDIIAIVDNNGTGADAGCTLGTVFVSMLVLGGFAIP
jgi:hypothetical protein